MSRNVEIKATIESVEALMHKAAALSQQGPTLIAQDDTFFRCVSGRLKLRAFSDNAGELIFYRRADQAGPRESFYVLSPTASPATLREALTLAHGQVGRVRKQRTLFIAGRTRIHLDRVEGLGDFLELEVVLRDGESPAVGEQEAHALMTHLGVAPTQLIEVAYLDLLAAAKMPARFETGRPMRLAGLRRRHRFPDIPNDIPAQWREFTDLDPTAGQLGSDVYGVMCGADADSCEYMCAVEVEDFDGLPATLGRMRIQEQRYAVFPHRGHVAAIRHTWSAAFQWLADSTAFESAQKPDFEVYGAGFDPVTGVGDIEIRLAIIDRHAPGSSG